MVDGVFTYQDAAAGVGALVAVVGLYWTMRRNARADLVAERGAIATERADLLDQHRALNARLQGHIDRLRDRMERLEVREAAARERLAKLEGENRRLRAIISGGEAGEIVEFEKLRQLRKTARATSNKAHVKT